jgi:hypothetical protein
MIMATLSLEANKTALIRDILDIDNAEVIHRLHRYLRTHSTPKAKKMTTSAALEEFCGAWKDDTKTAEEMVDDIYNNRLLQVRGDEIADLFNE